MLRIVLWSSRSSILPNLKVTWVTNLDWKTCLKARGLLDLIADLQTEKQAPAETDNWPLSFQFYLSFFYQKWTLNSIQNGIYPFVLFLNLNLIQNGKIPFHIDIIYRIDNLCSIIFELDRGKPPLPTERYDKFIDFWSINYRFRFKMILLQEFAEKPISNWEQLQ